MHLSMPQLKAIALQIDREFQGLPAASRDSVVDCLAEAVTALARARTRCAVGTALHSFVEQLHDHALGIESLLDRQEGVPPLAHWTPPTSPPLGDDGVPGELYDDFLP